MSAYTICRGIKLTLMLSLLLLITGCWDRNEVNDVALITAAAVDKVSPNAILLSVQIFVPRASAMSGMTGQSNSIGNQTSMVTSAIGENIADALSHIQERLPRKLFWGHSEVFIFSEDIAKDGIRDEIDYLMRAPQPRERAYMYVAKGKARQLLDAHTSLERNSAEVMRELSKGRLSLSVTLAELAQMLVNEPEAAAIPWIDLLPVSAQGNYDKAPIPVNGTAIFRDAKMIGLIDEYTTRGVLWIRNEIKQAVITINPEESPGLISLRLINSSTKLKPLIQNGKWTMEIQIGTENSALQNSTALKISTDPKALKIAEAAMNEDIEARVRIALDKVQREIRADIFDFGGAFHRAYPKEWQQHKAQWGELFPKIEVTIHPHATIQRPGLTNIKEVEHKE